MFSSCALIGIVFCHSKGHYVTAKSTVELENSSPLGFAIELHPKCPSKRRLKVIGHKQYTTS